MIKFYNQCVTLADNRFSPVSKDSLSAPELLAARNKTIAYRLLQAHNNSPDPNSLALSFDALMSHDITFVGIIQTARASGMTQFPIPYVLTNCHNSLCAVGGTINDDDHAFGLSAAKKFGGIYLPANLAVCHQFMRELYASCGSLILGSDSHTRYGCYGTMGFGEGGGELAKQLLGNSYDLPAPEVVLVWLEGAPRPGVGPHDVAISLCKELFPDALVKNKILEFAGPGVAALPMDFRIGIDVMTTETSCLSSIWITDDTVKLFYESVGRPDAFRVLDTIDGAFYDSYVTIDLSAQECMIALPFHPSNACSINELRANPRELLEKAQNDCNRSLSDGLALSLTDKITEKGVLADQAVIVGCAGGMYDNLIEAAAILDEHSTGNDYFNLSVYPSSAPVSLSITRDGTAETLMKAGAVVKPAFCGPCFGAGDTPAHNALSIRHATRNFPNREGSKPSDGQISAVALMDARSIAATAANGGIITPATDISYEVPQREFRFDPSIYNSRVYFGFGKPIPDYELRLGPNITDWPTFSPLSDNLLLKLCAVIDDEVTTTDELIPSGETSSYRSNPIRLSEFALSRRVPDYVSRSKAVRALETARTDDSLPGEILDLLRLLSAPAASTAIASCIFAKKPGDGSAREQAASCQKVLGGGANICFEYATKRYRSNCINWGLLPFTIGHSLTVPFSVDDYIYIPNVRQLLTDRATDFPAILISGGSQRSISLHLDALSDSERQILLDGCLINYYAASSGR